MMIPNLGTRFLESTDDYLKQNWQSLTCANIFELYDELYKALKSYKGNSHGFTGYSEYLLFRFLYHQTEESCGTLEIESIENSQTASRFHSVKDPNFWISQGIPFKTGIKRQSPDLAIGYSGEILRVASIKIYLVNGIVTLQNEVVKLEQMRRHNNEMRASIIMFHKIPQKHKAAAQKLLTDREWLRFSELRDNRNPMATELGTCLVLNQLLNPTGNPNP